MRQNRTPSLRGSVTQNNVSVRMRANDKSGLGFLTRLGLLAGVFLIFAVIVVSLWRAGWPQQQAEHLRDVAMNVTQKAQFAVKDIVVEGRHHAAKPDIIDALGTERGAPIFDFDGNAAAAKLAKLPWVDQALVERRLPDTIFVSLTEREPTARWQHDGHIYVIDAQGHVLPAAQPEEFPTLPLVVGAGANNEAQTLFVLLKNYPMIQEKLDAVVRVGERRWDLHLQPKITVMLPEEDDSGTRVNNALHRLAVLITQEKMLDRDISTINLTLEDQLRIDPAPTVPPTAPAAAGKPAGATHK